MIIGRQTLLSDSSSISRSASLPFRIPIRPLLALGLLALAAPGFARPRVITSAHPSPRELYAAERLRAATASLPGNETILLAQRPDATLKRFDRQLPQFWPDAKEAFLLRRFGSTIVVTGFDASGVLYGALELTSRIAEQHALPRTLDVEDHPQLKLRGTAIGMQKPEITYDGAEYDYRYTQEDFPFFYDKAYWTQYLDTLATERYNTLYLWNGHPFTSLLKLPKYPEAQELPTAQLDRNIEMFKWLTAEADRRGIWVLQGFYNIHLSHTFAKAHGVPNHLSAPTPLSTEYTRYCIAEFIREYPNVGLMMTLGEAMGPHYGPQWIRDAIIPGVKDGVAQLSKQLGRPVQEPPIVIRAHATDIDDVMSTARPLYSNIDTMFKWNGESFTWTNVRGSVRAEFERLVAGSNVNVANIHLLSNFEPFRWGDPDFIRQTVLNFQRIGIGGMHVYPLRYWDWPVSADKTEPLLQQTDRDWIWYQAWGRYAWNPNRDPAKERAFWISEIAAHFGNAEAAEHLLNAYELAGICAPKLLPRVGITEGNRQVLSLGMTMPQLIDAARFSPAQTLWTGDAPEGERLDDYVQKEFSHQPHKGETPLGVASEVAASSTKAVTEAEAAAAGVTSNKPEYDRIVNDMRSIAALMAFYNAKTQAAEQVMLFGRDHDASHLTAAEKLLAESVDHFRDLNRLADPAYRNVAGMQTSQRQIPVRGAANTNHWRDLLPVYEKELAIYRRRLSTLSNTTMTSTSSTDRAAGNNPSASTSTDPSSDMAPLPQVPFTLAPGAGETFTLAKGQALYADKPDSTITDLAPELNGLTGIRVSAQQTAPLHFTLAKPAQIVIGFFKSNSRKATNVAVETEQWNILLPNAVSPSGKKALPITAWTRPMPAGQNDLDLGKGAYIVLGFIPEDAHVTPHINFSTSSANGQPPNLDWMFED